MDYASALAHKALAGAAGKGGRMLPEDLLYLLRKVPEQEHLLAKYARPARAGQEATFAWTCVLNQPE